MKRIVFEKWAVKLDKWMFIRYKKIEIIRYYLYHPIEKNMFILKHANFLEKKKLVLKKISERKIKI
jgi:hypothetical protein